MRRERFVKVSLSDIEYEKLRAKAEVEKLSPAELLRDVVKAMPTAGVTK